MANVENDAFVECGARIATRHPRISQTCVLPVLHEGDHSSGEPQSNIDPDDFTTPEGYDDSPDQGVHRYDGGGTFF